MRLFLNILRGVMLGLSAVIPGISGGTVALSMGIYDLIIEALTGILKHPVKSIKQLLPYIVGAITGVLLTSLAIEALFDLFPVQTRMLFAGMLIGVLPMIFGRVKGVKLSVSNVLALLIMAGVVVGTALFTNTGVEHPFEPTLPMMLLMTLLGFIAAATMVIPGISGSMMLMLMGYYQTVLNGLNSLSKALFTGGADMAYGFAMIIPFALGAALGIFACAWMIKKLMARFPITSNMAIIGLIGASPFGVLYGCSFSAMNAGGWVVSILLFAAGFVLTWRLFSVKE